MKRLLTVTAFTAMLALLRMAAGFVIAKVIAVYIGPTGMAMLGQVQSMVASLNGLVSAPAGSGVIRFTAEHYEKGFIACAPWWRASLRWIFILLAVVVPLGFVLSQPLADWLFGNPDLSWLVTVCVCVLPFSAVGSLVSSVINGQQQYRRYVSLGMISVLISSSIMVVLIMRANLTGALLAASIQSGLIGVVMMFASLRQPWFKLQYWWGETESVQRKAIGGYVLMALTSALTVPVSLIVVRNILVANVGWEQTGQWQAVWKISETYLAVITMALGTYYLPRLSKLKDIKSIRSEINNTAKIVVPLLICMSSVIFLFRDNIISILFTSDFYEARNLFFIQLCGDVVKITSWLYAFPMLSRGATKWFISTELVFSLSFVLLSFLFINLFQTIGVCVAYLVSYIIYLLFILPNLKNFSK
jgi:PST family polysaccharide transporter